MNLLCQPIKAMIVDDDPTAIVYLTQYITYTNEVELCYSTINAREALNYLTKHPIDLLFLDIEMPGIDGMMMMDQLRRWMQYPDPQKRMYVIICSGHGHFALQTYDYQVTDFLLKPFVFARYMEAIRKVMEWRMPPSMNALLPENSCLMVTADRGTVMHRVNIDEIIYIEANDDKCIIWLSPEESYILDESLKKLLSKLSKAKFLQVHRSFAIALAYFESRNKNLIKLKYFKKPISIGNIALYSDFQEWLKSNEIKGRLDPAKKISNNKQKNK